MRRKPCLIVMLKTPVAGRVKTRLAGEIGRVPAAWWFRHNVQAVLRQLRDPRWDMVLGVTPYSSLSSTVWPCDLPRIAQGAGDLGARMSHLLRQIGPRPACVIGGDIPGIRPAQIQNAFQALGAADAVVGPAPDGGYWLLGLAHPMRQPWGFLQYVRWSTSAARRDTMASAPGLRWAEVDRLSDVDTLADLQRLRLAVKQGV
nr:glycosyltransferase [uncultured Celeribacter sp.]